MAKRKRAPTLAPAQAIGERAVVGNQIHGASVIHEAFKPSEHHTAAVKAVAEAITENARAALELAKILAGPAVTDNRIGIMLGARE